MRRAAEIALTPLVRGVEWLFGPRLPGLDLQLASFALYWLCLRVFRPEAYDRCALVGLGWLPDGAWIGMLAAIAALHLCGLFRPGLYWLRQTACLLSAWIWIAVSVSLVLIEWTTGVGSYAIVGGTALAGALYLQGRPRNGG